MKDFRDKTIRGIGWSTVNQVVQQTLRFVIGVILARLLSPREFGLVAMITVITNFAVIFSEFGLSSALIQKQDAEQIHYSSAFWLNFIIGILLTLILIICSPLIAEFYNEPILRPLTIFISFNFLISSLNIMQNTLLTKSLDFRTLSIVRITSVSIAGALAIVMAISGFGVWSLAVQSVSGSIITLMLMWRLSTWRPIFKFNWSAIKELLGFSINLMGTQTYNYWTRNLDNLLIGRFLGSGPLGIYNRAYNIMLFPLNNVSRVISRVMFPSMSMIQKDKARVKKIYLQVTRSIALITFPLMSGLFVTADSFVIAVFGQQWEQMIPILRIFCFLSMEQSITTLNGNLFLSQGRADIQFKMGLVLKSIVIIGIVVGLRWGVIGVAIGYAITSIICIYPSVSIAGSLINLTFAELVKNLTGVFACCILMAVLIKGLDVVLLVNYSHAARLAIQVLCGIALFYTLIHFFRVQAYLEVRHLVSEKLR